MPGNKKEAEAAVRTAMTVPSSEKAQQLLSKYLTAEQKQRLVDVLEKQAKDIYTSLQQIDPTQNNTPRPKL